MEERFQLCTPHSTDTGKLAVITNQALLGVADIANGSFFLCRSIGNGMISRLRDLRSAPGKHRNYYFLPSRFTFFLLSGRSAKSWGFSLEFFCFRLELERRLPPSDPTLRAWLWARPDVAPQFFRLATVIVETGFY